ncbi:phosphate acyltransferase PlsX [Edaphobacter sp. 12200R-103]|jgi:glycerol-3-phosphate acyltransferase PlsX|uniref:phosphate acyltransferase PlsX n=1 Tax=Edaphobacter sp. 12200R-103 TaxID=2703788 RepID=UPI00138C6CC9|nr:phosphate acyltransferase PlsX [Edaphobacter sp. 12200R-103]QHS53278.1 phosphate acyltransferase PlsX [Edaphobacter sp. 12200R-103]
MPIDIVVDAMGSDKAPDPEIRGAVLAARHYDVRVHLVGPEDILRPILRQHVQHQKHLPIFITPASEWITMGDKAAQAVRTKRDSTMRVGLKMVREGLASRTTSGHGHGKAAGFFTAGNTGAAMATAKMVLGMLSGVDRPALASAVPTTRGVPSLILDVGANVDCDPDNLVQFAVMGHIFAQNVLKVPNPRVGLLSIGEEDSKGNSLTRDTLPMLRSLPGINFIGNVEGRDIYNGNCDVIVCDGFVGNVALKASEGIARLVTTSLREALKSTVTSQVGALLSRRAFGDFKKRLDYNEYGGAPLLGVRGVCIVGHGSSNEKAVMNGIRVAAEFAHAEVNAGIEAALLSSTATP